MGNLSCPIKTCPLWKKGGVKTSVTEQAKIHRFPAKNLKVKEAWEAFVSEANGAPYQSTKYHGLCSAHFAGKYVMPSGRITRDAVPTIAPLSTKKVLCKWDISSSQLIPIASVNTGNEKNEAQHRVEAQPEAESQLQVQDQPQAEVTFPHPEALEMAPLEELDSEDIQDLDNCDRILNEIGTDVAGNVQEGIDNFLTPEQLNILNVKDTYPVPQWPKSLKTVKDIETAIKREKKLALIRYKNAMRRIRGLELLLKRAKDMPNQEVLSQEVNYSPVQEPYKLYFKNTKSPLNVLTKNHINTSSSVSMVETIGDNDLPPPLFDDCN